MPCLPKLPSCSCNCGFGAFPQLQLPQFPMPALPVPSLLPPPGIPQFPLYSGSSYVIPNNGEVRPQQLDNSYISQPSQSQHQQPFSYQIPSSGPDNRQQPSFQGIGNYGFGVIQYEQKPNGASGGYVIGPYGSNFGDSYNIASVGQNENGFGESSHQVSGAGIRQYLSSRANTGVGQDVPDSPAAATSETLATESSPPTGEYVQKTRVFLKQ
ncbi:unnamed protein product [Thelazia callipaeda]|uniref:Uncharacterized protein n=1 Tax=Thelazia callipaeda TaxID=103827 RepID=A0A0N5CPD5_THECL|nr:unnamed protein product [Thelazia callipaeda]